MQKLCERVINVNRGGVVFIKGLMSAIFRIEKLQDKWDRVPMEASSCLIFRGFFSEITFL